MLNCTNGLFTTASNATFPFHDSSTPHRRPENPRGSMHLGEFFVVCCIGRKSRSSARLRTGKYRFRAKKLVRVVNSPELFSVSCTESALQLFGRFRPREFRFRIVSQAKPLHGEDEGEGDKEVQELLVDLIRLETGKVRVNDFVEDRSKFLTEIAEQANEEFDRIAEEAKKTMDEAGSKVLEQMNAEATEFEEELAEARAEMEANEREFEEFERKVEKARSEGLFFKSLFAKPSKPWKKKTPEEQKEILETAKEVKGTLDQETKKAAGSKFRRTVYLVMIFLLTLTIVEAISLEKFQWTKVIIYVIILFALVIQLVVESTLSTESKEDDDK